MYYGGHNIGTLGGGGNDIHHVLFIRNGYAKKLCPLLAKGTFRVYNGSAGGARFAGCVHYYVGVTAFSYGYNEGMLAFFHFLYLVSCEDVLGAECPQGGGPADALNVDKKRYAGIWCVYAHLGAQMPEYIADAMGGDHTAQQLLVLRLQPQHIQQLFAGRAFAVGAVYYAGAVVTEKVYIRFRDFPADYGYCHAVSVHSSPPSSNIMMISSSVSMVSVSSTGSASFAASLALC